jgi:hypothetical protein
VTILPVSHFKKRNYETKNVATFTLGCIDFLFSQPHKKILVATFGRAVESCPLLSVLNPVLRTLAQQYLAR